MGPVSSNRAEAPSNQQLHDEARVLARVAEALVQVVEGRQRLGPVDDQVEELRDAQRRERLHRDEAEPRVPGQSGNRHRCSGLLPWGSGVHVQWAWGREGAAANLQPP